MTTQWADVSTMRGFHSTPEHRLMLPWRGNEVIGSTAPSSIACSPP